MTKYLLYTILGLPLTWYIMISSPQNVLILDLIGLTIFSIGTGLYLKNNRLASILTLLGLGITAHTFSAIWYNLIVIKMSTSMSNYYLFILILFDIAFLFLIFISIHGSITNHSFKNKIDLLLLSNRTTYGLAIIPIILWFILLRYCVIYMR